MDIFIDQKVVRILEELQIETKRQSVPDLIEAAFKTYAWIVDHQKNGHMVVVKDTLENEIEELADYTR